MLVQKKKNTVWEEATHFTNEESSLPSTQGIQGQAETRIEVFRRPATGVPLCV